MSYLSFRRLQRYHTKLKTYISGLLSGYYTKQEANATYDAIDHKITEASSMLTEAVSHVDKRLSDAINGTTPVALSDNMTSWNERGSQPTDNVWTGDIRTSGGELNIDSSKGVDVQRISVGTEGLFRATAYKTTGYNLLRDAVAVQTGFYVLCPKLTLGTLGTSDENNGVMFTDSNHQNIAPTVYFKAIGNGLPASTTDGVLLTPTVVTYGSKQYRVYTTSSPGYLIVSGIDRGNVCMKMAWSRLYDDYISISDADDAGDSITLWDGTSGCIMRKIHAYDYMVGVETPEGIISDEIVRESDTVARWYRRCDRVTPQWTHIDNGDGTYTHSATITAMRVDSGAFLMVGSSKVKLEITGQTASFTDDSNFIELGFVYYVKTAEETGTQALSLHAGINDWGIEGFSGVEGTPRLTASYYQGIPDALFGLIGRTQNAEDAIAALKDQAALTASDIMAARWDDGQSSPVAQDKMGDDSCIDYVPVLIDHRRNDVKGTVPVGELMPNNHLRFKDGRFAPVVCITEEMYNECMDHDIYLGDTFYAGRGTFDPEDYYRNHVHVIKGSTCHLEYELLMKDGPRGTGTEVTHYLMPWETTSRDYSVLLAPRHTLYFLQNAQGRSGKVWNALSLTPKVLDGLTMQQLKPTAISVTTPTNVTIDGTRRARCHFAAFNGSAAAADGYTAGVAGRVTDMFLNTGRMMGECNLSWNHASNGYVTHARGDNADPASSMPFAEGGWHSFNAFNTWLEVKYGTRDLEAVFRSGISGNDACTNEAQWLQNGGVRCRVHDSQDSWEYRPISSASAICYYKNSNDEYKSATWSEMLNLHAPLEACMEAQIAASMATEMGVPAGATFECYGMMYRWAAVNGAVSLADGRMNCIIYSERRAVADGYTPAGEATSFDLDVMLRMSLFEGATLSGDVYNQRNGGLEAVGTCRNTGGGSMGNLIEFYAQPDQELWLPNDTKGTLSEGGRFDCEDAYQKIGELVTVNNGYSMKDVPGTPFPAVVGAGMHTYMAHYGYVSNYWNYAKVGNRARIGLRFLGISASASCSRRALNAYAAVGNSNLYFSGSVQVRLQESATPTQSE